MDDHGERIRRQTAVGGRVWFLDELRAVVRGQQRLEPPPPDLVTTVRHHVYQRLQRVEQRHLAQIHDTWSDEARLTSFVARSLRELDRGLSPGPQDRLRLLVAILDAALDRP
jgi:hypothetical protein